MRILYLLRAYNISVPSQQQEPQCYSTGLINREHACTHGGEREELEPLTPAQQISQSNKADSASHGI